MNNLSRPIMRYQSQQVYDQSDNDAGQCCSMDLDSVDDDWSCMRDIILTNGQILEYVGHGRTILDNGFAQAKNPLTPTYHYFEIEIIDPGENCYIAIGLTHKDYPKNRHPGWDEGSVAYHADDGKIFVGSGIGEDFGPKCDKGDILGCGISFYTYESDDSQSEDGSSGESQSCSDGEYSSSSTPPCNYNSNVKKKRRSKEIEVFFTRNGSIIGSRSVKLPETGFYPSIGMLSVNEKVRFDLKPLTG